MPKSQCQSLSASVKESVSKVQFPKASVSAYVAAAFPIFLVDVMSLKMYFIKGWAIHLKRLCMLFLKVSMKLPLLMEKLTFVMPVNMVNPTLHL